MPIERTLATARDGLSGHSDRVGGGHHRAQGAYHRSVEPVGVTAFERLVAEALDGLPTGEEFIEDDIAHVPMAREASDA